MGWGIAVVELALAATLGWAVFRDPSLLVAHNEAVGMRLTAPGSLEGWRVDNGSNPDVPLAAASFGGLVSLRVETVPDVAATDEAIEAVVRERERSLIRAGADRLYYNYILAPGRLGKVHGWEARKRYLTQRYGVTYLVEDWELTFAQRGRVYRATLSVPKQLQYYFLKDLQLLQVGFELE